MTTPLRTGKISEQQKAALIDYITQNEQLKSGKFTQEFTYKKAQNCWKELAIILNAIPGGAEKDWHQWRKTWHDLRTKTESKSAAIKAHREGTGGGEAFKECLTATEEKIVELMCPTSIAGHQDTLESEVVNILVDPDVPTISPGDCGINSETTISVETEDNSSFD
ncbi:uncharacterized protein LOC123322329 [Coccinella septempunctata]|uniref:uncharacterized protein LOC123322329 n=1 Tax=Coccinella septempunctata TaxID=41139 RepID=UPI001D06C637|nr:uncharacterized protein LOC123322329 [Coccinella septempunctata]